VASEDLSLHGVTKRYEGAPAVDDLTLSARPGEFLFLLGPSGCGKTTTLRIVAGFVRPDAGEVRIRGHDVARVPPYRRRVGLVFQSYALFPHLTVAENVAFGLRMRHVGRAEIRERVKRALELVQLHGLDERLPRQLSGGQQQRVALARATVIEPDILLLDEPFSNLDQRLRQDLRQEVRGLQRRLGITSVFVTHDQEEALSMADRIALMRGGRLEQVGTPDELYEQPASPFVATFLGDCNVFRGTCEGSDGGTAWLRTADGTRVRGLPGTPAPTAGSAVVGLVRPERMRLTEANTAVNTLGGVIDAVVYRGGGRRYVVRLPGGSTCLVDVPNTGEARPGWGEGGSVCVGWSEADCRVLPA
jgi:putative spermidine/putrescine transport system ATP-binding protein